MNSIQLTINYCMKIPVYLRQKIKNLDKKRDVLLDLQKQINKAFKKEKEYEKMVSFFYDTDEKVSLLTLFVSCDVKKGEEISEERVRNIIHVTKREIEKLSSGINIIGFNVTNTKTEQTTAYERNIHMIEIACNASNEQNKDALNKTLETLCKRENDTLFKKSFIERKDDAIFRCRVLSLKTNKELTEKLEEIMIKNKKETGFLSMKIVSIHKEE